MDEETRAKKKNVPQSRAVSDNAMIVQIYLEELRALGGEIKQHETSIRSFFIFNLTALGALFAFAFSKSELLSIILLVPILSSIIGIISSLHAKRKNQLAHYIKEEIAPRIRITANDDSLLRWQEHIKEPQLKVYPTFLSLDSVILMISLLISFGILFMGWIFWINPFSEGEFSLWLVGLILTIVLAYQVFSGIQKEQT